MNDQVMEKLNELLLKSMEAIDSGAEFMAGEIPEIVTQLLIWKGVESFIYFFVFGVLLYLSLVGVHKKHKDHIENLKFSKDEVNAIFWCGRVIVMAIGFAGLMTQIVWIKILIAPKLYLFEYAAKLIN